MNQKHLVISSYSDLDSISPFVKYVHFRKFISKSLIKLILSRCENIEKISISEYAYSRCDKIILELIQEFGIKIIIKKNIGRPSMLERMK